MPRFYFHLQAPDGLVADRQGAILPDHEAAWYHAFRSARDLIDEAADLRPADLHIEVETEGGQAVLSLPLIEVVGLAR